MNNVHVHRRYLWCGNTLKSCFIATGLFLLISLMASSSLRAQSCQRLILPHNPPMGKFNPDSVMVDTCSNQIFAKRSFRILLKKDFFATPQLPRDSVIIKHWTDIDTSHYNIRHFFESIEDSLGNFSFNKIYPDIIDTNKVGSKYFLLQFTQHQNIQIVDSLFNNNIDVLWCDFVHSYYEATVQESGSHSSSQQNSNVPNLEMHFGQIDDQAHINSSSQIPFHRLSTNWNLLKMNVPMAWEVTKGDKNVVFIQLDADMKVYGESYTKWHSLESDIPSGDMVETIRKSTTQTENPNGNLLINLKQDNGKFVTDPGNGTLTFRHIPSISHSLSGATSFNAIQNQNGLVGVAPAAKLAGIDYAEFTGRSIIDVDHLTNGIQDPDGMYPIARNTRSSANTIDKGILFASNPETIGVVTSEKTLRGFKTQGIGVGAWHDGWFNNKQHLIDLGCYADQDIKQCTKLPWDFKQPFPQSKIGHYYNGNESLQWEASCLTFQQNNPELSFGPTCWSYFSTYTNGFVNLKTLVVPTGLWVLAAGSYDYQHAASYFTSQINGVLALMKSVDKHLALSGIDDNNKYLIPARAFDITSYTAQKVDVSKCYVRKLLPGAIYETVPDDYKLAYPQTNVNNHPIYATEIAQIQNVRDPLSRSYSVWMGFGLVDAFRCVAHAIPDNPNGATTSNVRFKYESSNSLDWTNAALLDKTNHTVNSIDKKVLHLGKYYQEGLELLRLDYTAGSPRGGHVFRKGMLQEPIYKNGNGKTIVNTTLNVGGSATEEQVLAIDGIMTSDNTQGGKIQTTTNSTGKILATGYLDNVIYEGNVKLSDLKVIGEEGKAGISFKAPANKQGEIYGEVMLYEHGFMKCESGKTVIRPGGIVRMKGTQDIIVKSGAVLEMDYASEIYSDMMDGEKRLRKIIVEDGGILRIPERARAVILDCIVHIKEGGLFVMERGAGAKLYKLELDPKGTFVMEHGLISPPQNNPKAALDGPYLILDNKEEHIANGHFLIGTAVKNSQGNYEHWSTAGELHPNLPAMALPQERKPWIMGPVDYCNEPTGIATIKSVYDMRTIPDLSPALFTNQDRPQLQASFKVQNARFLNALIDIKNTHTTDIQWCEFSADGAQTNSATKALITMDFPHRFSLMRNFGAKRRVRFSESYVVNGDLTVANNELFDRKSWIKGDSVRPPKNGNVDLYTGEAPLSFKNHKLDGIRIIELQDFIMHDNVFRYCLNGLHNMGFFLNVYDNRFISCASGSYCESVGTFCSNKFTRCEKSLDLANSGSSNITNNAFAQAGSGIWVASGATAYIKGNNFADFYHGVQTSNASVNLSGIYTVVNTSEADRIKIGHNQFGTGQPTTLENFRINSSQFTHSINNISDINFTNQYDYADMRCGKNIMTPVSNTYHLFKEKEDVNGVLVDIPLRRAIMVKRNDWNHNSGTHQVIRNFASGIPQVPIAEIVQLDEGELSTPCATEIERQTCYVPTITINPENPDFPPDTPTNPPNGIIAYQDPFPNDGALPNKKQDTAYINQFFHNAYHFAKQTIFPDWLRKQKIFDATQSALLHHHDTVRLDSLLYRLKTLSTDSTEDTLVRIASWVNLAKLYEFKGNDDSTFLAYSAIMNTYPDMPDAKIALWQRNFVAARLIDTSYGTVYQNALNYAYRQDILGRLGIVDSGLPKYSEPLSGYTSNNATLVLHQNSPNPFSNETAISFTNYAPIKAKISVLTLTGTIVWTSGTKDFGAGFHSIPISLHTLSSGTYFYRLETDMGILVKQMTIIK